jgi:rSAM/selenodomain-associated transferase 2
MSDIALSIIIPARNDAEALGRTLDHLERLDMRERVEVVVAAAGERPSTEHAVGGRARLLWPDGSTRARLMNAGAGVARAPALLFLHADSLPPRDAVTLIAAALERPGTVGGAFEFRFAEPVWALRLLTAMNRIRYRTTRNYYGDQGLFVRADVFHRLGGFRDLALMEDIDWSRRLRRAGRTVLIRTPIASSGRRFLARGPWRTTAFCAWLLLLYTLRLSTERYAERWRGPADRAPGSPWPTPWRR